MSKKPPAHNGRPTSFKNLYLVGLIGILGLLTAQLFLPFLNILVFAFIIVEIFFPVYKMLHRAIQNKGVSSLLTTIIAFTVVTIPLSLIIIVIAGETVSFSQQAQEYIIENDVITEGPKQVVQFANDVLASFNVPEQYRLENIDFTSIATDIGTWLATNVGDAAGNLLSGGLGLLFQIFLLIISMIYMFQMRENMGSVVSQFSPLDDRLDQMFFDKFISTTRAVIKGTAVVALAQATAVAVVMVLMGFGAPVLLWLIMLVASILPIGSGIVWAPAGVILMLTGQPLAGIFLIVYGAVSINVIDSLLRPYLLKNSTHLHPLVTLFSVLGGLTVFGLPGILYGPLITVFLISAIHVYKEDRVQELAIS